MGGWADKGCAHLNPLFSRVEYSSPCCALTDGYTDTGSARMRGLCRTLRSEAYHIQAHNWSIQWAEA